MKNAFQVLAASFQGLLSRSETLHGRKHVVVPIVMLIEGVHKKLFYPSEEIASTAVLWNGIPIVVGHPEKDGQPISANSPEILNQRGTGTIFNAQWEDNKLRAEAWIDEQKANDVSPEILQHLTSGVPLEISTGLFTDHDATAGEWNGEAYEATVSNFRPDHLALLPGGTGACSFEDGCGIRANANQEERSDMKPEENMSVLTKIRGVIANFIKEMGPIMLPEDQPPPEVSGVTGDDTGGGVEKGKVMEKKAVIDALIACPCTRWNEPDRATLEALSEDVLGKMQASDEAMRAIKPKADETPKPLTLEDIMAKAVPEVNAWIAAKQAEDAAKIADEKAKAEKLISDLTANAKCPFTKDELAAKPAAELEKLAGLLKLDANYAPAAGGPETNGAEMRCVPPVPAFDLTPKEDPK